MTRAAILSGLLALALVEAGLLVYRTLDAPRLVLPIVAAGEGLDPLRGPGGAERQLAARGAVVGEWVTIEHLARGALSIEEGAVPGAPALAPGERATLAATVRLGQDHRDALLAVEAEIAAARDALDADALAIAASLTAEQLAFVRARRDQVSVADREAATWAELAAILDAE